MPDRRRPVHFSQAPSAAGAPRVTSACDAVGSWPLAGAAAIGAEDPASPPTHTSAASQPRSYSHLPHTVPPAQDVFGRISPPPPCPSPAALRHCALRSPAADLRPPPRYRCSQIDTLSLLVERGHAPRSALPPACSHLAASPRSVPRRSAPSPTSSCGAASPSPPSFLSASGHLSTGGAQDVSGEGGAIGRGEGGAAWHAAADPSGRNAVSPPPP